jgi:hypothetical protein
MEGGGGELHVLTALPTGETVPRSPFHQWLVWSQTRFRQREDSLAPTGNQTQTPRFQPSSLVPTPVEITSLQTLTYAYE